MNMTSKTTKPKIFVIFLSAGFFHLVRAECTIPGSPFEKYDTSGTIQSPGYPDRYYGNEECDWEINPPVGTVAGLLIVKIIKVETAVPDMSDCLAPMTQNYVDLEFDRACGNESSLCVAYITQSSPHCHDTVDKNYPKCVRNLFNDWPFKVKFRTAEPDNKAGFKLEYDIVACDSLTPTTFADNTTKDATEKETNQDKSEIILIVTLVCVLALAIIVAVVFRKEIKKWAISRTESSSPGDVNMVPMEDIMNHERHPLDTNGSIKLQTQENTIFNFKKSCHQAQFLIELC